MTGRTADEGGRHAAATEEVGGEPRGGAVGTVERRRAARTLPLRVELARQLRRPRTAVVFGLLAALPVVLWLAFSLGGAPTGSSGLSFTDVARLSGPNFAVFVLFAATSFLVVVVVALFFGEAVASEAAWSSLRYLLLVPVPRVRLLRQKVIAAALLSVAAIVLLAAVALALGTLVYGDSGYSSPSGEGLDFGASVARLGLAVAYVIVQVSWAAAVAALFSVLTDAPLGAVGGTVMLSIVCQILGSIEALGDARTYLLPTTNQFAWLDLFRTEVNAAGIGQGVVTSLVWAVIAGSLAVWRFHRADVTS